LSALASILEIQLLASGLYALLWQDHPVA